MLGSNNNNMGNPNFPISQDITLMKNFGNNVSTNPLNMMNNNMNNPRSLNSNPVGN